MSSFRIYWSFLALAYLLLSAVGCVHRRAVIRSDPPGAQVWINDKHIGPTPCAFDFNWYGTEEITLQMDGYEVEHQLLKLKTPWYQVPPLDFVSDNLLPYRVKDQHDFYFKLRPRAVPSDGDLLQRGNQLRTEAQIGQ